jgi:hypothetical protein
MSMQADGGDDVAVGFAAYVLAKTVSMHGLVVLDRYM